MPTAIYASARDFEGDRVVTKDTLKRIDDAVAQLGPFIKMGRSARRGRVPPTNEDANSDLVDMLDRAFS